VLHLKPPNDLKPPNELLELLELLLGAFFL
jgi:hypothetical protein